MNIHTYIILLETLMRTQHTVFKYLQFVTINMNKLSVFFLLLILLILVVFQRKCHFQAAFERTASVPNANCFAT